MKIKSLPTAKALSESIKWNLSGSTLMHIVMLLGFSFYISKPIFQQSDPIIKVKLNSDTQLSSGSAAEQTLQSFNFSMDVKPADIETQELSPPKESFAPAAEVIQSQYSELDNFAEELERLREQQAKLAKELREGQQMLDAKPREVFTTSYSDDSEFNDFKESCRQHIEAYGNVHYPKSVSSSGLSGTLLLDAVIRSDGSLLRVDIVKSSDYSMIDKAAIDIVNAATPCPAMPAEADQNVLLHIIRTWQFKHNNVSSSAY